MTDTKHEGDAIRRPWRIVPQGEPNQYVATREHPTRNRTEWLATIQFNGELTVGEQEAIVGLASAASVLLEALRTMVESLSAYRGNIEEFKQLVHDFSDAREAIALAEGRSQ